ncbi:hypothetical protein OSB04_012848 [Centaurea solstitialis]|uniref:Uncharacterized protein n=1 Tax=Centaurea solstitialis TaxID=347529 RepID=A0AA38TDV6_9ASTR|nr:hypothetical protein OSB04_012848 [Centaurea solstitialis]
MALQAKDNYFDTGSSGKPPRFNKDNFALWKTRMELFLSGSDPQIPYFLEHGPHVPTQTVHHVPAANDQPPIPTRELVKPVTDWNDEDRRLVNIDTKARSLIAMSLPDDIFHSVCHLRSPKEIWNTLCVQYEVPPVATPSSSVTITELESSDSDMSEDPDFNESLALLTRSFKKFAKKGNFQRRKPFTLTHKPKTEPVDKATAILMVGVVNGRLWVALAAAARPTAAGCLTAAPSGGGGRRIQTATTRNHLGGGGIRRRWWQYSIGWQTETTRGGERCRQMASTVTSTNNLSLHSILEKDKLTGPNFLDWEHNLMIVLRHERKWYVLEEPLGEAPTANAPAAARNAHKKHSDDLLDVACLMLASMSPDLQAGLINTNPYDMIRQLGDLFQTQARTERYDATKAFNECKMIKGTSVSDHVMKMKRHLDHLERLGHLVPLQLATDTILNSLSDDYKPFVVNYNMNNMEKSIAELHSMLKTAELNMGTKNKTKDVLMVRDGGVKKKHGHTSTSKGKGPVQAVQSAPKVHNKGKGRARARRSSQIKLGPRIAASHAMRSVIGGKTAQSVMKQVVRSEMPRSCKDQDKSSF